MKYTLIILLFVPFSIKAQWTFNPDTVDHPSLAEYCNLVYKASTHQAYHILNVVPQLCTNQPPYVAEIAGGPHDFMAIAPIAPGNLYVSGSVFSTASGAFQNITTDSAGNALPPVTYMLCSAVSNGLNWLDVIVTNDSTTGRQVGMAGQLGMGMHGNGTNTTVNQTSIVWATFPTGTHIIKVGGQYCLWALSSIGQVWTWGGAGNTQRLQRGTSPVVPYTLPDTIRLNGHHAIDIANEGDFGVIVLENGHVLGGGDQPKYWGGSSASASSTPQDFTSFLTSSLGNDPATGQPFVTAKVFNDAGAVYYIGVDSTLAASGDNICGEIGNGQMFPMNNYAVSPPPNGSTPQPYAYDNGYGEYLIPAPVRICPGAHNWVCGYMGPSNCWNAAFVNNKGETWVWGRGKSMQIMNNRASCDYFAGGLNGTYPDMINMPYPMKISPFTITSGTLVTPTCFYCIANPGATSCSQGTGCYNGSLAAPIVNATKQTLSNGTITVTITPSITYASGSKEFLNLVTFVSGPNTPLMPFNTGSTINISGLTSGTYVFKDSATDVMWKNGVAYDTIIIGNSGIGPICAGCRPVIVSLDSIHIHSILAPTSGMYIVDTLTLPTNSVGIFDLFFSSYDTAQKLTGMGEQKILLSRIGSTYQAPYVSYNSPYVSTGLSTHQVYYVVLLLNGLCLVQVSGYGSADPIRWQVAREQKISSL